MRSALQKKVRLAIKLLQAQAMSTNGPLELCYSGGKDSDVLLELATMAKIDFVPIYKNTTIDPPGTIKHCQDNGVNIMNPKKRFFQLIEQSGLPTRHVRFCCGYLKEYKIMGAAIIGVRKSESSKRAKRYKEPVICRLYNPRSWETRVHVVMPLLEWTDDDIKEFITARKIKCHPLYYDENGAFHVERRLGCIGCPLKSDNGLKDFKKYPKFIPLWIKHLKRYRDSHSDTSSHKHFDDEFEHFYYHIFCKKYDDFLKQKERGLNAKQYLETYFNIQL